MHHSHDDTPWWHDDPATENQIAALRRRGISIPAGLSKGDASILLDRPTPKQKALLIRHGLWDDGMSFRDASDVIGQLLSR